MQSRIGPTHGPDSVGGTRGLFAPVSDRALNRMGRPRTSGRPVARWSPRSAIFASGGLSLLLWAAVVAAANALR